MTTPPAPPSLRARYEKLRERRWFRWGSDAVFLLLIVMAVTAFQTRGHLKEGAVPAFSLATLDGKTISSADLAGKPALIAFWAPWCSVCKTETGNFSWAQKLVGDRARVISIAAAYEQVSEVQQYVAERGVDYPVLLGSEAQVRDFRVGAFPTVYFLDAQGRIKGSVVGYTTTLGLLFRLWW